MPSAERIVNALAAFGEPREAVGLAETAHARAPSGDNLMRIGLMANVPNQAIARGVKNVMERGGQFDNAKAGAQMAAGVGNHGDGLAAQFVGKLPELAFGEPAQIGRLFNPIKQRRVTIGHAA